ncbi:hypothetical protein AQI95_38045 [Streptomyces yokosukanensis]|uniref:Uncharacterized protein n=1 Tax=Streptomyces yokosukanensis TaxID=67386 RepID=A0A101NUJ6_9ACTN|nr:hypothetical protein [Streptomyces yokosukanensis]KUM99539.1 hypothetical protein AQI95_38045 [Streptomyces yokosukanensis]
MRRRSLTGTAACFLAATGLAAGLLGTAPAGAATGGPVITLDTPAPVALPAAPATADVSFDFRTTAKNLQADDTTLTVDARGLAKIAKVTFSDNCTAKGLVATCSETFESDSSPTSHMGAMTRLTLTPLKGAALGATGTYKVTGRSAHAQIVGGTGRAEVGGPFFGLDELSDHTGLKVGSTVSEPVRFTNTGNRPAKGVQTVFAVSPGLDFADHYSNCAYGILGSIHYAKCRPGGAIGIAETAALAAPVRLRVNSAALYTYLDTMTAPLGQPGWPDGQGIKWTWGKGAALKLKVVKAGRKSSAPAGSVSLPQNGGGTDYRITSLQARNTADFAVSGASARADAGKNATFAFRLSAHGPATLYDRSGGEGVPAVWVTLPSGTTAVGHSANCAPWQLDNPTAQAHGPYVCGPPGIELPKGQVTDFTLTLRVDEVVPKAEGGVQLVWGPDPAHSHRPAFDPNGSNDCAALTLN